MIPNIIHYIWLGGPKTPKVERCIKSWSKLENEGWIIKEWNESNLDLKNVPPLIKKYVNKQRWAYVSDYLRMKILLDNPGVYMDTDMYLIKNIPTFLMFKSFWAGLESTDMINTGIIGCDDSPRVKDLITQVLQYYENSSRIKMSPQVFTPIVKKVFRSEISVLDRDLDYLLPYYGYICSCDYFYPIHWTSGKLNKYRPKLTSKTVAIHEWTGSALGNDNMSDAFESNYRGMIDQFLKDFYTE